MLQACIFLLLVSGVLLPQTEGSWVTAALRRANTFMQNHCHRRPGPGISITCSFRGRRTVHPDVRSAMSEICPQAMQDKVSQDGITMAFVQSVFQEVDGQDESGKADGVLDKAEYSRFVDTLELYSFCMDESGGN